MFISPRIHSLVPAAVVFSCFCIGGADAQIARIEVHPFQTVTLSDEEFLTGAKSGKDTMIAGELRIPRPGYDRLPAVILVHGSGGIGANTDYWSRELNAIGIATFVIDAFAGRGIDDTLADQSALGLVSPIVDAYRALALLAAHNRVDPSRISLMGFSRGGAVALYASLTRFQNAYAPEGRAFAAFVAFYAPCNTRYIGDDLVSDKPIRLFHGTADDYVPAAPCRDYVERLRAAGRDAQLIEYPGAYHVFDNPILSEMPLLLPMAQTGRRCQLMEESPGRIVNAETKQRFTAGDGCIERGPHIAYNAAALKASTQEVKNFFAAVFKLN